MEDQGIKEKVKKFIVENYCLDVSGTELAYSDSFLEKDIIDSIGVIELVSFIQSEYKVKIEVSEIVPENFDTIENIEKYLLSKKAGCK